MARLPMEGCIGSAWEHGRPASTRSGSRIGPVNRRDPRLFATFFYFLESGGALVVASILHLICYYAGARVNSRIQDVQLLYKAHKIPKL